VINRDKYKVGNNNPFYDSWNCTSGPDQMDPEIDRKELEFTENSRIIESTNQFERTQISSFKSIL